MENKFARLQYIEGGRWCGCFINIEWHQIFSFLLNFDTLPSSSLFLWASFCVFISDYFKDVGDDGEEQKFEQPWEFCVEKIRRIESTITLHVFFCRFVCKQYETPLTQHLGGDNTSSDCCILIYCFLNDFLLNLIFFLSLPFLKD